MIKRSILPTATITLKGKRGHTARKRGLSYTCAERSFIKKSALEELNYKSKEVENRSYLTSKPVQEYEMVNIVIPHWGRLINIWIS